MCTSVLCVVQRFGRILTETFLMKVDISYYTGKVERGSDAELAENNEGKQKKR